MKNNKLILLLVGGLFGGIFAYIIVSSLYKYLGEQSKVSSGSLIILGLSISIFLFILNEFGNTITNNLKYDKKNIFMQSGMLILFIFLNLYGIYLFSENVYISWVFLTLIYSITIWIITLLFSSIFKKSTIKKFHWIGGSIGGLLGGMIISLIYVLIIDFSIDEGYFIFLMIILMLAGGIIGLFAIGSNGLQFNSDIDTRFASSRIQPILVSVLLIVVSLLFIVAYNFWDRIDLNESNKNLTEEDHIFNCNYLDSKLYSPSTNYSKAEIINFLENLDYKSIDVFAVLYLLSNDEKYADEFKTKIIKDAQENRYIGESGSSKIWQYEIMVRAYYYNLISKENPELFNDTDNELILNWFKKINQQAFKTIWVDYIYDPLFKKMPDGLYENQEIGVGMLSVLSQVLENKSPELVKANREYISSNAVGWKGNFRNPDDGIVYHQQLWIKNAYMLSKYGGQEKYLYDNNSRNSFEWILIQWPPNGMSAAYNSPLVYTPFDVMALGAQLFHDGRYLWLSKIMLSNEIESTKYLDITGLEYWNDNLIPIKPDVGSCYIRGTTGVAQKPGKLMPDKIVFREGWEKDSLFALLNLRFSGWHSYKATNNIITIMYGEPFVVEKMQLINHSWLPRAKSDQRDKKIDRTELNGFQIENTGLQKIIYEITGLGNEWAQDPPRFAEVLVFNSTPLVDYSISKISNWHGWNNTRTSVLVKGNDSFLVFFDQNKGTSPGKVGVTWHLKGEAEISDQSIKLINKNYSMNVYFPHFDDWYRVENQKDEYVDTPAGDIHKADYTLNLISEDNSEGGYITLFYPLRGNQSYKIENIDVKNKENKSIYPDALGLKINWPNASYTIGRGNGNNVLKYNEVETNADFFIIYEYENLIDISYKNATIIKIICCNKSLYMEQNGIEHLRDHDWQYFNGSIVIYPKKIDGSIKLKTD